MGSWDTTVDSLVRNFLAALNASVPSMQAARILDDNLIGFDDWGRFCDLMYSLLVIEPIRSSLPPEQRARFDLPAYETEYESFEDFSLIRVSDGSGGAAGSDGPVTPAQIGEAAVFLRFLPGDSEAAGLSVVETIRIATDHTLVDNSYETVAVDGVYFTCVVAEGEGYFPLDHIQVNLK